MYLWGPVFLCDPLAAHCVDWCKVDLAHLAHAVVHFFPVRGWVDLDLANFVGDLARGPALCFLCLGRVAILVLESCFPRGGSRAHGRGNGGGGGRAIEPALSFRRGTEMVLDVERRRR